MSTNALRPVNGRFNPRMTSDAPCLGSVKVAVYEVVTVALLTGESSARCCSARMACHCASVGLVGLPWLVHTR
jgi:hypothetical protein